MQLEKEFIWDDALGCCFEVPPTQIDTDFTKQTQTLKYFSHFYRCWRPSRFNSPVFSTRNWGKLVAWNGTRLRLHPDSPAQTGCAVPKHSGLLYQWYQDKEAPHNAELHGWNTLKAELREQHPSQQHKKRLNYDMPHFFFFLPSKACWALVLFAWRVQTLNLCMWYTCCSRKQSQLDASLCNHTHSAVLATLGVYCSRPHRWWIMSERQVLLLTQALPRSPFAIVIIWINIPLQQVCTRTVYKKI